MNMNENKNNNALPAENSQVQQENESSEQREHQEDAKSNDNVPSCNLDGLTDNNPKAQSSATNGQVLNLEWLDKAVTNEIVKANTIIVSKDCCGDFGSRYYLRNLNAVTSPLDPNMGVPLHFICSHDGENETGDKSESWYIK